MGPAIDGGTATATPPSFSASLARALIPLPHLALVKEVRLRTMVESSRRHGKGSRSPTSGAGAAASSDAPPPERETGKMRIVDFLHEPHEGDDVIGDVGSPQRGDLFSIDSSGSPPRKFLPRWRLFPFRKPSLCSRGGETRPGSGHPVPSPHKKMKGRERGAEQEEDAKEKSKMAEGIDGRDCVRSLDPPAGTFGRSSASSSCIILVAG